MELFLCLALLSLSSAESMFRQNLHRNMDDHHLDQDHNVYKRDSGSGFTVSGDCTISPAGGDSYDVYSPSSASCYLTHEDCRSSTSSGGKMIRKIHDVRTKSSGSVYITFCSESTSGPLAHAIYTESSGSVYITNCCVSSCGKLAHGIYTESSGSVYITNCCASSCGRLANNVIQASSGSCHVRNGNNGVCNKR